LLAEIGIYREIPSVAFMYKCVTSQVYSSLTDLFTVRNIGPKSDHMERSDLAKRFFIAGWEGERAESQEREGERGRGLNTPQWDSA
jgi:hypothetical protein